MTLIRTALAALSTTIALSLAACSPSNPEVVALSQPLAAASLAAAGTRCFEFDKAPLGFGAAHVVGDVIQTNNVTIHFHPYESGGALYSNGSGYTNNSSLAASQAPEFKPYVIRPQIVPNVPLSRVTMRFGEQLNAFRGQDNNFEVNGVVLAITSDLTSLNTTVIGGALVTVTLDAVQPANRVTGTLEITAQASSITSFGIGGIQTYVDDVCMTP